MTLLTPRTFRLKPAQDAWLQTTADKQGHGDKAVILRLLIDRAIRKTNHNNGSTRKASKLQTVNS